MHLSTKVCKALKYFTTTKEARKDTGRGVNRTRWRYSRGFQFNLPRSQSAEASESARLFIRPVSFARRRGLLSGAKPSQKTVAQRASLVARPGEIDNPPPYTRSRG